MPKGKQFWNRNQIPPQSQEYIQKAQAGYWKKDCSECGRKAIFRAGKNAYCRVHRQKAVDWWIKHPMRLPEYMMQDLKTGGSRAVRVGRVFGTLPGDRGRRIHVSY